VWAIVFEWVQRGNDMRKVSISAIGGPEILEIIDAAEPKAGPKEMAVNVEAAGINYIDVYQRKGIYRLPLPYTPGFEGIGHIAALGSGVEGWKIGERVAWVNGLGSYAEQVVLPATQAIRVPESFGVREGLLFQAITAQYLVHEYRHIAAGDTVLVHAAAGGVGQLLVQWLKHLDARVIATVSNEKKADTAKALGADEVINYGNGSFLSEVLRLTEGRGVELAFDAVGQNTLRDTVEAISARGTAVSYGSASGIPPAIEPSTLIPKAKRLAGGSMFAYIADPAELQLRSAAVIVAIQEGWLKIAPATEYPLERVGDAHRDIENRGTQGKLLLRPKSSM
jgi:NADPH2:quinone reductase